MDESGNTGTRLDDLDQPIHYLVALGVEEKQVNSIEKSFKRVVESFLPAAFKDKNFEIKGQMLRKGSGASVKNLKPDQRIELAIGLLKLLANFEVKVFYTGVDKSADDGVVHPHRQAFVHTVLQLDDWLGQQEQQLGLLIADEQDEMEQRLIDDILLGKRKSIASEGGHKTVFTSIVDSVHFVRSSNNVLIQLADLVAFTINRGLRDLDMTRSAHKADAALYQIVLKEIESGYMIPIKKPTKVDDDSGSVTQTHS